MCVDYVKLDAVVSAAAAYIELLRGPHLSVARCATAVTVRSGFVYANVRACEAKRLGVEGQGQCLLCGASANGGSRERERERERAAPHG